MSKTKTSTPPTTDVAAHAEVFREVVLWARRTGVSITDLRVGEVHATLVDTGPPAPRPRPQEQSDDAAKAGLYGQYGGALLQDALVKAAADPTGDDEEDEDEGPAQR